MFCDAVNEVLCRLANKSLLPSDNARWSERASDGGWQREEPCPLCGIFPEGGESGSQRKSLRNSKAAVEGRYEEEDDEKERTFLPPNVSSANFLANRTFQ